MKYIATRTCEFFEKPLPPFDTLMVYRSLADDKLYARCSKCQNDGCMIEVEEKK
jgi:hypothetical protein